ncbi:hypothetical protein T190607A01A_10569 [Tenacibaculum sp. 190524A05c]|uniref:Uncharacterized protein n=1 Tax=Tenacibaculum platacis TaxID=3137852 RepID=A0ABP1EF29_9FLAO
MIFIVPVSIIVKDSFELEEMRSRIKAKSPRIEIKKTDTSIRIPKRISAITMKK